ncbi:MAG: hypothetical protein HYV63_31785 [Candidatus Schekmanbacteria bacterium]|nr:hypothetical protein [Candidatus Schekmanbacteria bacterium]
MSLVQGIEELRDAEDQNAASERLLKVARTWCARAMLFALKGDRAFGWQGVGFGDDSGEVKSLKHITVPVAKTFLEDVVAKHENVGGKLMRTGEHAAIVKFFGGDWPHSFVALPIDFQGRTVAVFYADDAGRRDVEFDAERVALLGVVGALVMENIGLSKGRGKQRPDEDATRPPRPQTKPGAAPAPAPPVAAAAAAATPAPTTPAPRPPRPSAPPVAAVPTPPPPDLSALDRETRLKHEKAMRKARVIVRDIVNYNTEKIARGLQTGNLAEALAPDIKKGRELYSKEVDPDIAARTDYFMEALVAMVANGDRAALGLK